MNQNSEYFINVGNFETSEMPVASTVEQAPTICGADQFDSIHKVLEADILRLVADINISKSSGLNNVSSFVLKEAFKILISEVTFMYNLSIHYSRFPTAWKQALVIPIPKAVNSAMVQNYRPISLLPLPGKILEKLVHQQLSNYIEMDEHLAEEPHGFRKGHSKMHAVAQLSNYIDKKLDSRKTTLVAYIDFKKPLTAFNIPFC